MIQSSVTKNFEVKSFEAKNLEAKDFETETLTKYIVEVHAPLLENSQVLAHKLVEKFNVRPQIAASLMNLVPGTVTKPVSQKEAVTISNMLSSIGLQVSTRQVKAKQKEARVVPSSSRSQVQQPTKQNPAKQNPVSQNLVSQNLVSQNFVKQNPVRQNLAKKYGLHSLIFLGSFLPAFLMAATALSVLMVTAKPALQNQLLTSARTPASVFASVAERVIGSNSIHSDAALNELDAALEDARDSLQQQNVNFVMITDDKGKPLAGWYKNDPAMLAVPEPTLALIKKQSQETIQPSENLEIAQLNVNNTSFIQTLKAPESLEVVAEAIEVNGKSLGAVVVGVTNQALLSALRSALTRTVAAGTVLVAFGLLVGIVLSRVFSHSRFWQKLLNH
jgi:hypothetical protein